MTKEMIEAYQKIASELSDRVNKTSNEDEREVLRHLVRLALYEAEYGNEYYGSEESDYF